jgi:hypothetical protein
MVNKSFQNSLTNRDSERFTASLREGGSVIPRAANGIGIEETVVRGLQPKTGDEVYSFNDRGGDRYNSFEGGGSGSSSTENTVKENEPNNEVIEETVVTGTQNSQIVNPLFNLYINNNNTSLKGSYNIVDYLEPESLKTINEFTKDNENVSLTDVYSILYAESSGGQQFHDAAKGPLQIQLGAFIDSQVYQKRYKPVPKKGTPERAIYMAKAKEDFDGLDELGQVTASLNYLEYLNKRFERNNKRKPTLVESATMYNQGYNGAKPYIANPSTYIDNTKLNTYINNVSDINAALNPSNLVPNFNQGGITTEPWGGANASLYPPPQKPEGAEPSSVQEQTEEVFK